MLLLVCNDASIENTLGTLATESEVNTVAGHSIMQGDDIVIKTGVSLLVYIQIADTNVLGMCLLKTIEVERGIAPHVCLNHLSGKEIAVIRCMITEEELYFRPLLNNNQNPAVNHKVNIRTENINHLYSPIDNNILRYIDKESILSQHCVEGSDGIPVGLCELGIVFSYEIRILLSLFLQRTDNNTLGKQSLGFVLGIEAIIDNKIERRTQIRHIALECVVRIDRNVETVDIQSIVGFEELHHVSIFISLHLLGGKSLTLEVLVSLITHGVHDIRTMTANHPATFVV